MDVVIASIGIVFIVVAAVELLKPEILKRVMSFFVHGRRLYFVGVLRFALAITFLLGARECDVPRVIFAFAILFLISGMMIFTMRMEKSKAILKWYQKQPLLFLRIIAAVFLVVGAIITYCA